MSERVYILLDIVGGKAEQVAKVLQDKPGIVIADLLEGPPDVIMVVEASDRQKLAELTVQALAVVENMTENFRLLPTVPGLNTSTFAKSFRTGQKRGVEGKHSRSYCQGTMAD